MKILIIDIGTHSLKALYAEKKYRGLSIIDCSGLLIKRDPSLSNLEQITNVLSSLKTSNLYSPDKTIVIFPSEKTTNRFITLPFRDSKRISLTLPLEIEEELPFELEDIVFSWQSVETIERNSKVLTCVAMKTDISLFIDAIQGTGFDPDIITTGIDSLLSFVKNLNLGARNVDVQIESELVNETRYMTYVIIELGASKTNIVIARQGVPQLVRTINYGGDHITKTIMEEYQVSYDDAESFKINSGMIILDDDKASFPEDQMRFSTFIKETLDIIVRDINQTVSNYKATAKEAVSMGYITGCGWHIRNMKEYIESELKIELMPLNYARTLDAPLVFDNPPDEHKFSGVYAVLTRFIAKGGWKGFNFRKGDFAKTRETEGVAQILQLFKPTIKNLAYGLGIFFIYAMVHIFVLDMVSNNYRDQISAKFSEAFPDKSKRMTSELLNDHSKLSREIKERLRMQKTLLEGDPSDGTVSAYAVLRDLSGSIPKNLVLDIKELHINRKIVKIVKGIATNATVVKDVMQALENSGKFKDIKQGNIRIAIDGINKEFDLSAQYKGSK